MKIATYDIHKDFEKISEIWQHLLTRCEHSYFSSWGWVKNWIESIPADARIELIAYYHNGSPITAFFLGKGKTYRNTLIPRRSLHLNRTGIQKLDNIWIEYNCFLNLKSDLDTFIFLIDAIPGDWDEFSMANLDCDSFPGICLWCNTGRYNLVHDYETLARCIDLSMVRQQNGDYLQLLSRKTRANVRKSIRLYENQGTIEIESAKDLQSAGKIFEGLVQTHLKMWEARGEECSFGNDYFFNFHKKLINDRFETGEIQLLKMSAGSSPIGYLYNFVYQNKVYAYQTGFNYERDNRLKPGLIAHSKAIEMNAKSGYLLYDLLGGDDLYKKNLATGDRKMVTIRVQKPHWKFRLEKIVESSSQRVLSRIRKHRSHHKHLK